MDKIERGPKESKTMNDLFSMLPTLEKDDLKKLRALAGQILESDIDDRNAAPFAYRQLSEIIRTPPIAAFRKMPFFKKFSKAVDAGEEYIEDHWGVVSLPEKAKIWQTLFSVLVMHMESEGVPTGPKTISEHLHRLPEIVDAQFPGYRESGLLRIITEGILSGSDGEDGEEDDGGDAGEYYSSAAL